MVPGLVLALALLPGPDFTGPARVPVAFALSVGVFGLAALPGLILDRSIAFYPVIYGHIRPAPRARGRQDRVEEDPGGGWRKPCDRSLYQAVVGSLLAARRDAGLDLGGERTPSRR